MSPNKRYIPLNTGESAVLPDANTLLPRDEVYEPLAQMISNAVKTAEAAKDKPLSELREHNAISIDGARGTGKTAVLVNLKSYLKNRDVLKDVHILDPVDPTLLEVCESLFLHIIVAAVLHDKDVKEAQRKDPNRARCLNQALDKLTQSLESVETQQDRYGMDTVRAMYGNKQLADCVHDFFREVLGLLGKRLLILPIDDVDTALDRAFENLEIVRRYLVTPYVLPIISGDRSLYNEVTWRYFHDRLTKDSKYLPEAAYKIAIELALEYQRKILPFPRRLTMPEVSSYWQWNKAEGEEVTLIDSDKAEVMRLANFISWLDIFLTGPVNGVENSRLPLPIPSIRALCQLIRSCNDLIQKLPKAIREAKTDLEVHRLWQMPTTSLADMEAFQSNHQELGKNSKRDYAEAYKEFDEKISSNNPQSSVDGASSQDDSSKKRPEIDEWAKRLLAYFCFEPKAGAAYLILLAKLHWKNWSVSDKSVRRGSIFDTALFQPLTHTTVNFPVFEKGEDLSAWTISLANRLPEEWLVNIKSQKTILPYPLAEIGVNSGKNWPYAKEIQEYEIEGLDGDKKSRAAFLITLLAQHNFYTNAKQTMLLNIGRIFELIISSIAGPISVVDIHDILDRAPFYSTGALAPTKTLLFLEETSNKNQNKSYEENEHEASELISKLHGEIKEWRKTHEVDQIDLSPWLVYKVFNKVYSQVASNVITPTGMTNIGAALNMVAHTFYATWFAFGSFEKGELFGLPNVVATTNTNPEKLKNYESNDQFKINVLPFSPTLNQIKAGDDGYKHKSTFGKQARVVSYVLAEHPLKKWIDEAITFDWPESREDIGAKAEEYLRNKLDITAKKLTKNTIKTKAKAQISELKLIHEHMSAKFGINNNYTKLFKEAWDDLSTEPKQNALKEQQGKAPVQPQNFAEFVRSQAAPQPEQQLTQAEQDQDKGSK